MSQEVENALESADIAQQAWSAEITRKRLKKIGNVASKIAGNFERLLPLIHRPNASNADKLASEVIPLADACRFTARIGRRTLAPHSVSFRHGAWWMGRIDVHVNREPWGTVLVLGPSNYPLFLPGVQIIQGLAAGNAVVVKPAAGGAEVIEALKECIVDADIPADLLQILPTDIQAGQDAMRHGIDKVFLTGSLGTGRAVLQQLSQTLTPATMELSGCDAMFVLPKANLERAVDSLLYALQLNGGATCIAPRRIFVTHETIEGFVDLLKTRIAERPAHSFEIAAAPLTAARQCIDQAVAGGAEILIGEIPGPRAKTISPIILRGVTPQMEIARADLFAPVASIMVIDDMSAALAADRECPYSLGASVFGPQTFAEHWATKIAAGCVVVNDMIVPTADPRVAFGGHDQSGWGVTRGAEGLLEMTRPKTICTRHGNWMPHLNRKTAQDDKTLGQLLQLFHASGLRERFDALRSIVAGARRK